MREILFRGKATNRIEGREYRTNYENGDWVYGLLTDIENYAGFAEMTNINGVSGIEVDGKTIGQFTGLTDKYGTKIFEGDIVATTPIVKLDKRKKAHQCFVIIKDLRNVGNSTIPMIANEGEVVGNIHDDDIVDTCPLCGAEREKGGI